MDSSPYLPHNSDAAQIFSPRAVLDRACHSSRGIIITNGMYSHPIAILWAFGEVSSGRESQGLSVTENGYGSSGYARGYLWWCWCLGPVSNFSKLPAMRLKTNELVFNGTEQRIPLSKSVFLACCSKWKELWCLRLMVFSPLWCLNVAQESLED